ncbi:MAG TPA: hemerythrin domain-containing protein [Gammaproteobacteria bacterium]|nr:hemerythrin domain-containing protein [Gammaproteobacteria bacterium]
MRDLLEELHAEHLYMADVLSVIEAQLALIESGEPADYELLRDAVYFMTEYPDLFHHAREDLIYRRVFGRHHRNRSLGRELENAHADLRALGLAFRYEVEDAVADIMLSRSRLTVQGRSYLDTQRSHMRVEEEDIFPRIADLLDEQDWRAIETALPHVGPVGLREITRRRFRSLHDALHADSSDGESI